MTTDGQTGTQDAPQPACPICHRPDPAGKTWAVCPTCVAQLDQQLAELLHLHDLAHHQLAPRRTDSGGMVMAHRDPPLPLNLAALDLTHGAILLMTDDDPDTPTPPWTGLESWEQDWRTTLGLTPYGPASAHRLEHATDHANATDVTLRGVIAFLRAQWPLAAEKHPAADEFAADIRRMHTWAQSALGMLEPKPWTFACPADLPSGTLCGNRLRVTHAGADLDIHCHRCSTHWTLTRLRIVGQATGTPAWVDADTAARALHCTTAHLGPLVRDGQLRTRGTGEHRRYDINTPHTTRTLADHAPPVT